MRFIAPILAFFMLLSAAIAPALAQTGANAITGIRTGGDSDLARLVLETRREASLSMLLLAGPYRLVIDMPGLDWQVAGKGREGLLYTTPLKGYRFARRSDGAARLVVDLDAPAIPVRAFPIKGEGGRAHRLVIDLVIGGQTSFAIAAEALRKNAGNTIALDDADKVANLAFALPAPRPERGGRPVLTTATAPPPRPGSGGGGIAAPPPRPQRGGGVAIPLPRPSPAAKPAPSVSAPAVRPPVSASAESSVKPSARPSAKPPVTRAAKPSPTPQTAAASGARWVVFIDAGHGGKDPGAIGVTGAREKDINLKAARELAQMLEATGKVRAVLSRDDDRYYRLRKRIELARQARADVFISLHADAASNKKAKGVSIFTLSDSASDKEAAHLAKQENKADLIGGPDLGATDPVLHSTLLGMFQRESRNQSSRFAARLIAEMEGIPTAQRGHRFAGFAVLKAPDVPSVLIEMGFLTNRADEKRLQSRKYRRDLMARVARATVGYLEDSNLVTAAR